MKVFSNKVGPRLALLAMLALLATSPVCAQALDDYATRVPLTLVGEGPWYRLEVPMAVHLAARYADLRDLRVFNAEGQALAYALTRDAAQSRETRSETPVNWFPLRGPASVERMPAVRVQRSATGTLVELAAEEVLSADAEPLRGWLLDASAIEGPLQQLILDWNVEREGFQHFTIEASDDLQHWRSWGGGQVARLSFAGERIDLRDVGLPGQQARYLRLLWSDPQQAPLLTAARLVSGRTVPAPLVWSAPLTPSRVAPGEYRWDLPLALPLQRLRVELSQSNTLAPVTVSGRSDGKVRWQPLGRGLLYRLTQGSAEVLHDELELFGAAAQQLRLRVDERGGGLGSEAPQLRVGLRATQLVFLARGTPPYVLATGNPAGKAASLPLDTLIPGYDDQRLATLGIASAGQTLPAEAAGAERAPSEDWKRWGLWAVLLAGVGLLVLMALSLLRARPDAS
jgi:hypothetical protein